MRDRFVQRWLGVTLSLIGVVAILWLGTTGRLELYIHPRYVVFTIVMAIIGGALSMAAFLVIPVRTIDGHDQDQDHDNHDNHDGHDHDEDEKPSRTGLRAAIAITGSVALVAASVLALLVLPPATLSSVTADIADSTALSSADTTQLVGCDPLTFTVKDWATLLHQGLGEDFFTGKQARFSGFIVATDDPDVVYVARFLVTCCAVDAQPLGVPVLVPGWKDSYDVDDWVEVSGGFAPNPDAAGAEPIVLTPDQVTAIEQPAQPYVY